MGAIKKYIFHYGDVQSAESFPREEPFVEGTILQRNEKFSRITDADVPSPAATRR